MELEAEAYALHFQDKIKTSETLLTFAGILCHIEGDVLLYRMKSGLNDKIQEVIDRNEELKQIYDYSKNALSSSIPDTDKYFEKDIEISILELEPLRARGTTSLSNSDTATDFLFGIPPLAKRRNCFARCWAC